MVTRRAFLAVALAMLTAVVVAPSAFAHATLLRSQPSDSAVVAKAPRVVQLWFSEEISPKLSSVEVSDARGNAVEASSRVDRANPRLLTVALPALRTGTYSVSWNAFAEDDAHFTRGLVVFGVGTLAGAPVVTRPGNSLSAVEVALRWLNFGVLAALVGALAVARLVLLPLEAGRRGATVRAAARRSRRRVVAWALLCSVLALAVGAGLLVWRIVALTGELPKGASVSEAGQLLLGDTRWGTLWLGREGILLALVGVVLLLRHVDQGKRPRGQGLLASLPERLAWLSAGVLVLGLMVVQALTGHAAALDSSRTLALGAATLHLLASSVWVGGLLALIVGLWPVTGPRRSMPTSLVRACLKRFSWLATLSFGLVAATGLYYAGRQVASPDALVTTLYGRTLLAKSGLVLAVGAFGLLNSMLLHPRLAAPVAKLLRRPRGWTLLSLSRLRGFVLAEVSLGLLVLLAAGLLTAGPPARGPKFAPAPKTAASEVTRSVDDLLVTMSVKPNRPGENVFDVFAVSTRRPPPAEIDQVTLRFSRPATGAEIVSGPLKEVEPGRYRLGGRYLSLQGSWQIGVLVRRSGFADRTAQFAWTVASPGSPRPVVISDRPLGPLLTRAAAVILLLVLLAAIWISPLPRRVAPRFRQEAQRFPLSSTDPLQRRI